MRHQWTRRQFLLAGIGLTGILAGGGVLADWVLRTPTPLPAPRTMRPPSLDSGASFEVIAVGSKQELWTASSPDTYAQAMRHWLGSIQPSPSLPRLIVFPEDVGLILAFLGLRGAPARRLPSSTLAMASLLVAWWPEILAMRRRFPDVPLPPHDLRLLWLALANTMVPTFWSTFANLARQYHAYVVACMPCPPFEVTRQQSGFPTQVAPTAPAVYNTAFLFGPDGAVIDQLRKVHLVPVEHQLLSLSPGRLEEVHGVTLPGVGKVGVVISKDAWMPDVLDRLEMDGVEILIQPDANDARWASRPVLTAWPPDGWKAGNWVSVQKHMGFELSVNPMMTGNLFELPFDGQTALVAKVARLPWLGQYIGQAPEGGFVAVAPWVVQDPVNQPLPERRRFLASVASALAPGSRASLRNRYQATVIVHRDALRRAPQHDQPTPLFSWRRRQILAAPGTAHWLPNLAKSSDGTLYLTFVAAYHGQTVIGLCRSDDGGATFSEPRWVEPVPSASQWHPVVAAWPQGRVAVAWIDNRNGDWQLRLAASHNRGQDFSPSVTFPTPEGQPLATRPCLLTAENGSLLVAWSDNRLANAVGAIYFSRSGDFGRNWSPPLKVSDCPTAVVGGVALDTGYAWNPSLASDGDVVALAWQDFRPLQGEDRRTRRNQIRWAISLDGGHRWQPSQPLQPDMGREQYVPRIGRVGPKHWAAAWVEQRSTTKETFLVTWVQNGQTSPVNRLGSGVLALPPAMAMTEDHTVWVAWTTTAGTLGVSRGAGGQWQTAHVAPNAPGKLQAPTLATLSPGHLAMAWTHSGPQNASTLEVAMALFE